MNDIPIILVPYDFSATAKNALDYAVNYVGRDADLKIVLAYTSNEPNEDILKKAFQKIGEKYRSSLKHEMEWRLMDGALTESLLRMQQSENIELIIMGTSGASGSDEEESTNTSKLVLDSNRPILVVPVDCEKFRVKHISLVLGKEEIDNPKVLETLLNMARKFNAKVHVVTIENKPESYGYSASDEKNENAIQYYLENFYSEHMFIENPDVVEGILSYATEKEIDMIAILPRNHVKRGEPSEGQLTQMLTLHSKIPILAIE